MVRPRRLSTPAESVAASFFLQGDDHRRQKILVSIIIPCYNEALGINHTIETLRHELIEDDLNEYEFIFVDDHSTDRTGNIILDHCETNPSIKLVRLGSNCGSHVACRAGLEHCSGDVAIFLTADLQEGPDLVPRVIEKWREGAEVVCSIAQSRDRGSLLSNAAAWLYYYLVGRFDRLKHLEDRRAIPRLLSRKAIHHYCQYAPRNHNMTVWLLQQRFPLGYVSYTPLARKHGSSKWTLRKRIQLAVNTFLDITPAFLTGWLFLGMAMVLLGLLAMVGSGLHALLTSRLANAHLAFGISGVVALSTGLILMAMGLLGTYLWRIYDELRNGPEYTVQRLANIASCLTPDQPPVRPG